MYTCVCVHGLILYSDLVEFKCCFFLGGGEAFPPICPSNTIHPCGAMATRNTHDKASDRYEKGLRKIDLKEIGKGVFDSNAPLTTHNCWSLVVKLTLSRVGNP